MSTNKYVRVDYRINSVLVGANCYRVLSSEDEFSQSLVEEITTPMRQNPGRSYMRGQAEGKKEELWMVPFRLGDAKLETLLEAVEEVNACHFGKPHFNFPLDIVSGEEGKALVIKPVDRGAYLPIRTFMPKHDAPRWKIATSLFRRVQEMGEMGITSNGLTREQLRVDAEDYEVNVWLNETMSLLPPDDHALVTRPSGFLSVPRKCEEYCSENGIVIDGGKRDLFSAAVAAFYLIVYTHPFIGSEYFSHSYDDYRYIYQNKPQYIMEPDTENDPGNQMHSRAVMAQWGRTVPSLKALFDGLFMAITYPQKLWDDSADYWNPGSWLAALELDERTNAQKDDGMDYSFLSEVYHLV